MADTSARSGQLEEVPSSEPCLQSGASGGLEPVPALGSEIEHAGTASPAFLPARAESTGTTETVRKRTERDGNRLSVEEQIEHSKSHWSEVVKPSSRNAGCKKSCSCSRILGACFGGSRPDPDEKVVEESNVEVFKALQSHPTWGSFFRTFGYDLGMRRSSGSLVVGKKFAEGGQAELFHAHIIWENEWANEDCLKKGHEWVLKVFKKGTLLSDLEKQWPRGLLQSDAEKLRRTRLKLPQPLAYTCDVLCATLLENGRFAFVMKREVEDLRALIDRDMKLRIGQECGPFEKGGAEVVMYCIVLGMQWLHDRDIVHRDLKASNVLVSNVEGGWRLCVSDFECSNLVIGTGFWRALEILQAIKDRSVYEKPEVFSKEADVYAFGMTCYEILTGKLPFGNHRWNDYDLVLNGQRPEVPKFVDEWMHKLLSRCWHSNLRARPSFGEIKDVLLENSVEVGEFYECCRKFMEENGIV